MLGAPVASAQGTAPTSTTLSAGPTSPVVGQPVTYTAVVAPTGGGPAPTGTVSFSDTDGQAQACDARPLSGGSPDEATCTIAYPTVESDTVVARYGGDATDAGSSSSSVTVTGEQAQTVLQAGSSGNPSRSGHAVAFRTTVEVAAPGAGTPTGTVTFAIATAGGQPVACTNGDTVTVVGRRADCRVAAGTLQASDGPYHVAETYSGDTDFLPSSATLSETVDLLPSRTRITSSANPDTSGAAVTYTAIIRPRPAAIPEPQTGTVTFSFATSANAPPPACEGGDAVTLFAGQASCTVELSSGTALHYEVVATYSGDDNNGASSSRTLRQRISR